MTLKNWKKIRENKTIIQFQYKNENRFLFVYKQNYVYKKGIDWFVEEGTSKSTIWEKKFKTKPSALKFAKEYMRKN